MEKIVGKRGSGKTTRLIKKAAKEDLNIITATRRQADNIYKMAKGMGLKIKYPISINEIMDNDYPYVECKNGILIDDTDLVLSSIFRNVEVKGITLSYDGPNKGDFRDNLLVTAGVSAAYMECSRVINLPHVSAEEDKLSRFLATMVDKYIDEQIDIPFTYYIESKLLKEYAIKED